MPQLIKDGALCDDSWVLLPASVDPQARVPDGPHIVPLALWQAQAEQLQARTDIGVWLDCDQPPELLAAAVASLPLIAVNFPVFSDGRGYSYGRLLRERYGFTGELRAIGDVLQDQLFYLKRCGFNAYAIRADRDSAAALAALGDFSDGYQATADQPQPLFRRR